MEKRISKIDGFGIFATSKIKKDKNFYQIPVDLISDKPESRFARIGKNKYVNDNRILNWINHSCEPNAKMNLIIPYLVSLKDILPGEEITVDYDKTELNNHSIKCKCNSKKCRGFLHIS